MFFEKYMPTLLKKPRTCTKIYARDETFCRKLRILCWSCFITTILTSKFISILYTDETIKDYKIDYKS